MDQETRELRAEIAQTRGELGASVERLSAQLTPRGQAQQVLRRQGDLALQRLRGVSAADVQAGATRLGAALQQHPRGAAAVGVLGLLLVRRARRR